MWIIVLGIGENGSIGVEHETFMTIIYDTFIFFSSGHACSGRCIAIYAAKRNSCHNSTVTRLGWSQRRAGKDAYQSTMAATGSHWRQRFPHTCSSAGFMPHPCGACSSGAPSDCNRRREVTDIVNSPEGTRKPVRKKKYSSKNRKT